MAKQKTKKAASKRFHFSSTGKARHRKPGQAHFNARNTGNQTRDKHSNKAVDGTDVHRLVRLIPYK
jgi:ribosomal protein L35